MQRAPGTSRANRETDESAEIDQPESHGPRAASWDNSFYQLPKLGVLPRTASPRGSAKIPLEQSNHVRIDQRARSIECEQKYSVRDVTAHSRKRQKRRFRLRDLAAEVLDDRSTERRQARAAVQQTERTKQLYDLLDRRVSKRVRVWKSRDERLIDSWHQVGTRPLKQQLGNQDLVWVARTSPLEVATVPNKPTSYLSSEPREIHLLEHWAGRGGHPARLGGDAHPCLIRDDLSSRGTHNDLG
jgi:hypothetical protein